MKKLFAFLFIVGLMAIVFNPSFAAKPSTEGGVRQAHRVTDSVIVWDSKNDTGDVTSGSYYQSVNLAWYVANNDGLAESVHVTLILQGSLDGSNWMDYDSLAINTDGAIRKGDTAAWNYELAMATVEDWMYHRLITIASDSCDNTDSLYVRTEMVFFE